MNDENIQIITIDFGVRCIQKRPPLIRKKKMLTMGVIWLKNKRTSFIAVATTWIPISVTSHPRGDFNRGDINRERFP
jgi:hypothetical protein